MRISCEIHAPSGCPASGVSEVVRQPIRTVCEILSGLPNRWAAMVTACSCSAAILVGLYVLTLLTMALALLSILQRAGDESVSP